MVEYEKELIEMALEGLGIVVRVLRWKGSESDAEKVEILQHRLQADVSPARDPGVPGDTLVLVREDVPVDPEIGLGASIALAKKRRDIERRRRERGGDASDTQLSAELTRLKAFEHRHRRVLSCCARPAFPVPLSKEDILDCAEALMAGDQDPKRRC